MGWFKSLFGKKEVEQPVVEAAPEKAATVPGSPDLREAVTWEILDVDVNDVAQHPTALDDIYQGKIDGLYIRNAVRSEMLEDIEGYLEGIETAKDGILMEPAPFGFVVGRTITGCAKADLETVYFPETEAASNMAKHIFNRPIEDIITDALTPIAGGRKVALPKFTNGDLYKPCTFRVLKPGRTEGIRVHIGNEFIQLLPQLEHITSLVDRTIQLSYFIVVQEPEDGGELLIFDKVWKNTPYEMVENRAMETRPEQRERDFEQVKYKAIRPRKGDMFLFDGGRIWHKVSPVKGNTSRITIGGFAGFGLDKEHLYYYA